MKLFASKTKELEESLKRTTMFSRAYWEKWREVARENARLKAENEALRADLNEYREILCNKQKEIDALHAQVEQMRGYIAKTAGAST